MRKKINSEAGFSLVEMLAAVAVLILLGLMLNTGLQMALNSYRTVIAQSEAELLLSTAVDALADELRYAWDVKDSDTPTNWGSDFNNIAGFTYSSDSYGKETQLCVKGGQIIARTPKNDGTFQDWQVLSTGAYGAKGADGKRAYKVMKLEITLNDNNTFTIKLKVATADEKIIAHTSVTVRCLNPMK